MSKQIIKITAKTYKNILKPLLFRFDPESVHEKMLSVGEVFGQTKLVRELSGKIFKVTDKRLSQKICGLVFPNPVGLAAGFDYEAKLTRILPEIGFGFQTIGTITHNPYGGNEMPRLGRLPKSRSLMVNKGFKNSGAKKVIEKLQGSEFKLPVGISIGRTNSATLNQDDSVLDILKTFQEFELSSVMHSYYELNISCPNLSGDVTFYHRNNLKKLLKGVDDLKLKRPVFVKMPIERSDKESLILLETIAEHTPAGVIFGNLQKNRTDPGLKPEEVAGFKKGYFSGKPTFKRSNELISLAFKHFRKRFVIIGCGGVFDAEDAYLKISLGASLVQLITGMVYQGPQLINQINTGLVDMMERDGVKNISEIVGSAYKS